MTSSVEEQTHALWADIKCEMVQIAAETDIAFTTDFWTRPASKSFMTMSMHWIMQDWRLRTRILGAMHFPKKHTATNISDSFLNACIDFGVWPTVAKGRIPESEEILKCEKLAYFGMELPLDRPALTSDCASDVSTRVEKTTFGNWNPCAYQCLNIAMQSALKYPCIQKLVEPLVELAHRSSRSKFL